MTYYMANWSSELSIEAFRDDWKHFDLAFPVGAIVLDRDEATIKLLLETAWEEEVECMRDPDDEDPLPTPAWKTEGWNEKMKCQSWYDDDCDNPVVVTLRECCVLANGEWTQQPTAETKETPDAG